MSNGQKAVFNGAPKFFLFSVVLVKKFSSWGKHRNSLINGGGIFTFYFKDPLVINEFLALL
jgi:hypothetical protein